MPSKKLLTLPRQQSKLAEEVDRFITTNQQAIAELLTFVDFADKKLTISFVEINFAADREILIEILKKHSSCKAIQFVHFDFPNRDLRFLRDTLVEELQKVKVKAGKKIVLIITGLETSIGMSEAYPPVLQDLNFVRDAFTTSVPHPIIFCLPDYALTRLAKYAPDFWAWRSGVFYFKTAQATKDQAIERTLKSNKILEGLELPEKQERVDLLQRLLMEYSPSKHHETVADVHTRALILLQLGVAYRSQGDYTNAKQYLEQAQALVDPNEEVEAIKASILHELGSLKANEREREEALVLYQQSLEITERIGDIQGKAATLHQLAMLKTDQGEIEEAIALYQQSLELQERIGDIQGKAATLHNLAGLKADLGEIEEAIALYHQSLELKERIGNVQGKAVTLHQLASLKANLGEIEEAIALYHQSLEITERIGDIQTKAVTLHQLASLKANLGEIEEAIALYQQSLEIDERIGNSQVKAATLAMLGHLLAVERGDFTTALDYLKQSLDILQRIKSPDAETVRKIIADVQTLAGSSRYFTPPSVG